MSELSVSPAGLEGQAECVWLRRHNLRVRRLAMFPAIRFVVEGLSGGRRLETLSPAELERAANWMPHIAGADGERARRWILGPSFLEGPDWMWRFIARTPRLARVVSGICGRLAVGVWAVRRRAAGVLRFFKP